MSMWIAFGAAIGMAIGLLMDNLPAGLMIGFGITIALSASRLMAEKPDRSGRRAGPDTHLEWN